MNTKLIKEVWEKDEYYKLAQKGSLDRLVRACYRERISDINQAQLVLNSLIQKYNHHCISLYCLDPGEIHSARLGGNW